MRRWNETLATLATAGALMGCAAEPLPPSVADDGGTDDDGPEMDLPPDPCAASSGGGDGPGMEDGGPVKFDVGSDEFEFPKTCAEVVDTQTNIGCEFWAVDLPNDWRGTDSSPPAADQQFAVVVANASSIDPANVAIYLADQDTPLVEGIVEVDETFEFQLDPQSIDPQQNTTDGLAFRIESDIPITAYQFNPLDNQMPVYSNDASLLFPSHVLADDYAAVTGDAVFLSMHEDDLNPAPAGAFVSVVATEDDTMVDIFPSATLFPGETEGIILDRGRVFTVLSDANSTDNNLSSTRVIADKPVAVFAGNVATVEPIEELDICCADHLEHQMLPFEAWSDGYAVAPPASPNTGNDPAVYRITAAFDDTELVWCPARPEGAPWTLHGLQTDKFESSKPFTVKSRDPEKPIAITQFLESNSAIMKGGRPGDPAMISLPAAAQFQYKYVFAVPKGYSHNYVTVVARGTGDLELDGEVVPAEDFTNLAVIDGVMHTYVHRAVEDGSHRIEADVPIGITVVGYDDAVSFGFPGGVGLKVIAPTPPQG